MRVESPAQGDGLRYRPDIDGLRAVAVLLVIIFHAFPRTLTGGYIGVDVFFVISGFLITSLVLQELECKEFSFGKFYGRRIRRIFPALITVLLACFAAGWFLLLPREFKSLGLNIFGGAAFSSNFILLGESGYFDVSAVQKPLLHLWSLGIEEQFYIVWPALLLFAFTRRISIAIIAVTLLIASFAWNIKEAGTAADFYVPMTRAWELMIGGVMAASVSSSDHFRVKRALPKLFHYLRGWLQRGRAGAVWFGDDWRSLTGLVLIAGAAITLNQASAFPGWWALLPTLGAALIISAHQAWFNRTILSSRILVLVGLISYPLYLWHWPLLSFTHTIEPLASWQIRIAVIVLALGLAWLTYRWIEMPIRTGRWRSGIAGILSVIIGVIGGLGLITFEAQGFSNRIPPALKSLSTIPVDEVTDWRLGTCLLDEADDAPKREFSPKCLEKHHPLFFLWGDSFAAALYPGMVDLQHSLNFGIAQFTTAGCPPLLGYTVKHRPRCAEHEDYVFSVLKTAHTDTLLLYAAWNYGDSDDIPGYLKDLITKVRALNIPPRIVILGPPPQWAGGLRKAAYDWYEKDRLHRMIPLYSDFRVDPGWYAYQKQFRSRIAEMNVEYISLWDALCEGTKCRTWVGDANGDLMAFDEAHLTVAGAKYLAHRISPCLFGHYQGKVKPIFCDEHEH